jgi:hypothetical protein
MGDFDDPEVAALFDATYLEAESFIVKLELLEAEGKGPPIDTFFENQLDGVFDFLVEGGEFSWLKVSIAGVAIDGLTCVVEFTVDVVTLDVGEDCAPVDVPVFDAGPGQIGFSQVGTDEVSLHEDAASQVSRSHIGSGQISS